jgi:hypothetical protein
VSLRIEDLVIDCADPIALSKFWAEALGLRITTSSEGESEVWAVVGPERRISDPPPAAMEGKGLYLYFQQVPEGKAGIKNRLHLDLRPARTRDEEVERLRGLGAKILEGFAGSEATWIVMQDPEENEFCVLRGPEDPVPPGAEPVEP